MFLADIRDVTLHSLYQQLTNKDEAQQGVKYVHFLCNCNGSHDNTSTSIQNKLSIGNVVSDGRW